MASSYSPLKIELMVTGEQSGDWGDITNTNLGTAIEQAITGSGDVTFAGADVTLTLADTNASQTARNLRLNLVGTVSAAQNLIVPAIEKQYIVNNTLTYTITVKNSTGAGVAVPAGKSVLVFNNGTTVTEVLNYVAGALAVGGNITLADAGSVNWGAGTVGITASSATNTFYVSTAGVQQLQIDSSGSISTNKSIELGSLNASNAAVQIDFHSVVSSDFDARVEKASGANSTFSLINTGTGAMLFYTDTTERMRITGTGDVGINTTSPTEQLDVDGIIKTSTGLKIGTEENFLYQSSVGTVTLAIEDASTQYLGFVNETDGPMVDAAGGALLFGTVGTERMRIDSNGNVGIGNTAPSTSLGIYEGLVMQAQGVSSQLRLYTSDSSGLTESDGATISVYGKTLFVSNKENEAIVFETNDTERMRINNAGYVGIGTGSPSSQLETSYAFSGQTNVTAVILGGVDGGIGFTGIKVGYKNAIALADSGSYPLQVFTNNVQQMGVNGAGSLLFNSGYGSSAVAYGCRAWVNFNGAGTVAISGSGNVSSITDNGAGDYTINFTNAMPDTNYSLSGFASNNDNNGNESYVVSRLLGGTYTTAACRVVTVENTAGGTSTADSPLVCVQVFR